MKKIAPSILSADFSKLGSEIEAVESAGADWIHVDVMDGHFVPAITIGPLIVRAARRVTKLPLDVHLMITDPDRYIPDFIQAGADSITVHQEASLHLHRTLQLIKQEGAKAAVAINPATPVTTLDSILDQVEMILLMTVNPGFGGQEMIPSCIPKVAALKETLRNRGLDCLIEVDGGVKVDNIAPLAKAGADVFVAGSAIFGSKDYRGTIASMKERVAS